tara:strand:- start:672 stop:1016 length:345 start_codon:yes stop_codon:yes gene_type:complete
MEIQQANEHLKKECLSKFNLVEKSKLPSVIYGYKLLHGGTDADFNACTNRLSMWAINRIEGLVKAKEAEGTECVGIYWRSFPKIEVDGSDFNALKVFFRLELSDLTEQSKSEVE